MQSLRIHKIFGVVCAGLLLAPVTATGAKPPAPAPGAEPARAMVVRAPAPRPAKRNAVVKQDRTALVPFETAPFPYNGTIAHTDKPFLNVEEEGRRGHKTPYGRLYWEDETTTTAAFCCTSPRAST